MSGFWREDLCTGVAMVGGDGEGCGEDGGHEFGREETPSARARCRAKLPGGEFPGRGNFRVDTVLVKKMFRAVPKHCVRVCLECLRGVFPFDLAQAFKTFGRTTVTC